MTEMKVAVYAEALFEFSARQIDDACHAAFKVCKFFPLPANIREHVKVAWQSPDIAHAQGDADWKQLPAPKFADPLPPPPPAKPKFVFKEPAKTIEEQLAEMKKKGYLT